MTIYRDQLEAVYRLIEDPARWTQEAFAKNAAGEDINDGYDVNDEGEPLTDEECAAHPDARCWCLYGAAYKCGIYNNFLLAKSLLLDTTVGIADFNDSHTHAEVLALLTTAIERAPVREVTR